MTTAREYHRAVVLFSGKVLVAGGFNSVNLASAEIYDPAVGTWTPTGAMTSPRWGLSLTLLSDGRVLAAGGASASRQASAEIFNPASGVWTPTGAMGAPRLLHAAVLLGSGKVLVAGSYGGSTPGLYLSTAELFDPATGVWTATGAMSAARFGHNMLPLANGTVLVTGGSGRTDYTPLATSEIYNPAAATWSLTGAMSSARYLAAATTLASGDVMVTGGWGGSTVGYLASVETYRSATGMWTPTAPMAIPRHGHTATLLANGMVLIAGGLAGGGYASSTELLAPPPGPAAIPSAGSPGSYGWSVAGALNTARYLHTAAVLPSGKVLVAGGEGASGALASAEIYDPSTRAWQATGAMSVPREYHRAVVLTSGSVLVVGGTNNAGPIASAEIYDPSAGIWSSTGSMTHARWGPTLTVLADGRVLAAGGYNGGALASAELYDPVAHTWSATGAMTVARNLHAGVLLASGKVLVAGSFGGGAGGAYLSSAELYDPSTGTWSATGSMTTARFGHALSLLQGGKVLVTGGRSTGDPTAGAELYDPATGIWSPTGSMSSPRYLHTATVLPDGLVLVVGGWGGSAFNYLGSAELYDPVAGTWTAAAGIPNFRHAHSAVLLPSGDVLVAGGFGNAGYLADTRVFALPGLVNVFAAAVNASNQAAVPIFGAGRRSTVYDQEFQQDGGGFNYYHECGTPGGCILPDIWTPTGGFAGGGFIQSSSPWWIDPNHRAPGVGALHLPAVEWLHGTNGGLPDVSLNFSGSTLDVEIRTLNLQTHGAHLVMWMQRYDPTNGKYINFALTKFPLDTLATPGTWTDIKASLDPPGWVCMGSNPYRTATYGCSDVGVGLHDVNQDFGFIVIPLDETNLPTGTVQIGAVRIVKQWTAQITVDDNDPTTPPVTVNAPLINGSYSATPDLTSLKDGNLTVTVQAMSAGDLGPPVTTTIVKTTTGHAINLNTRFR